MKLREREKSIPAWLEEFDVWVTPSLTELKDTRKYKEVLRGVVKVFDALGPVVAEFTEPAAVSASEISEAYITLVCEQIAQSPDDSEVVALQALEAFASALFIATGKSDNNHKCQFPLYLKNQLGWTSLPGKKKRRDKIEIVEQEIPRVLKSDAYMDRIVALLVARDSADLFLAEDKFRHVANVLLNQFVEFVLAGDHARNQFVILSQSYWELKRNNKTASALLAPLVAFQVKGSVSASGGHEPEERLRQQMLDWGLRPEIDFNRTDVVLDVEAGRLEEADSLSDTEEDSENQDKKTRAFDFVLPFRVEGWSPRLFIQSQFYAGDSGSVSHKNVDQTDTSRANAAKLMLKAWPKSPDALFLEYVDGAGYSSALAGDLRKILSKHTTEDFFQIRSAPIRLRRQLQKIGFLTPLEIAHAVIRANGLAIKTSEILASEGYSSEEISRGLAVAGEIGFIKAESDDESRIGINVEHIDTIRRYLLLDLISNSGQDFESSVGLKGVVLVSGFGPCFGIELEKLGMAVDEDMPRLWSTGAFTSDIHWLSTAGFVILR